MAYNDSGRSSRRRRDAGGAPAAETLKGQEGLTAPICLNPGLDRGLAFIYAQGGSLLNDDHARRSTSEASAARPVVHGPVQDGLGMTAADLGSGWCGEALGKGQVAIRVRRRLARSVHDLAPIPDIKYAWARDAAGSPGRR